MRQTCCLLPNLNKKPSPGRPWADNREVVEGILWVLKTEASWRDIPGAYPSPSTGWRWLSKWEAQGVWENVWPQCLTHLDAKGVLGGEECFIDATFVAARKGVKRLENMQGTGLKMHGVSRPSRCTARNPRCTCESWRMHALAEQTLGTIRGPRPGGPGRPRQLPQRLVADKACDSRPLRDRRGARGADLIFPRQSNRKYQVQDGRKLRRYQRRGVIERTSARLKTGCRPLSQRWENRPSAFRGFILVAIIMICMSRLRNRF